MNWACSSIFIWTTPISPDQESRETEFKKLLQDTKDMLIMSDYKYAMAALPLAVEPIQKIRFIPYAHQRFAKFLRAYQQRFGEV